MERSEIQADIGEWLASGYTHEEIITELIASELSSEEAEAELRSVYEHWQHTSESLNLKDDDLINWHVYLRKRILQKALAFGTLPSYKLALSILDSLASVQCVGNMTQIKDIPINIILKESQNVERDVEQDGSEDEGGSIT